MTLHAQDPNFKTETKEDYTCEDELYAYAEMQLGRKVHRYQRNDMGAKNDGQLND